MIAMGLLLPGAVVAGENEKKTPFAVEFRTGAEYDSNLTLPEIDASSGQSDVAAVIDLHLGFDKHGPKGWSFNAAYDFSQSLYRQFDAFNLRIHRGSAGIGYDFGMLETGVAYQYANAALAGQEYLVLKQLSPHLGKLFGKRLFLRLAWDHTEEAFAAVPGRSATSDAPSLDAFIFFGGVKSCLVLGYQHVKENAVDDTYDYTGGKLKAQLTRRFTAGSHDLTLKTALHYESRTYKAPSPPSLPPLPPIPIEPRRVDDRYRFEIEFEAVLSRHTFLSARYDYIDNRSTVKSAAYEEHEASIVFGARL